MAYRCPHSKVVGTSEIKDYELEFRGVATIVPNKGARVPVLIWELELDERDLPTLNKYEGYPSFYRQEKMTFEMDGKTYEGMAYLMNQWDNFSTEVSSITTRFCRDTEKTVWTEKYLQTALENSQRLRYYVNSVSFDDDSMRIFLNSLLKIMWIGKRISQNDR